LEENSSLYFKYPNRSIRVNLMHSDSIEESCDFQESKSEYIELPVGDILAESAALMTLSDRSDGFVTIRLMEEVEITCPGDFRMS
jgi:hypothetical protein